MTKIIDILLIFKKTTPTLILPPQGGGNLYLFLPPLMGEGQDGGGTSFLPYTYIHLARTFEIICSTWFGNSFSLAPGVQFFD